VDSYKEGYDIIVAEDKVMDKGFKREFADLPALQNELLYKLFRKRPRYACLIVLLRGTWTFYLMVVLSLRLVGEVGARNYVRSSLSQ